MKVVLVDLSSLKNEMKISYSSLFVFNIAKWKIMEVIMPTVHTHYYRFYILEI